MRGIVGILLCSALLISLTQCDSSELNELDPLYLSINDSLVINTFSSKQLTDDASKFRYLVNAVEDEQFGIFAQNKIKRLKVYKMNDTLHIIKPILTGETRLIRKYVYENGLQKKDVTTVTYVVISE